MQSAHIRKNVFSRDLALALVFDHPQARSNSISNEFRQSIGLRQSIGCGEVPDYINEAIISSRAALPGRNSFSVKRDRGESTMSSTCPKF